MHPSSFRVSSQNHFKNRNNVVHYFMYENPSLCATYYWEDAVIYSECFEFKLKWSQKLEQGFKTKYGIKPKFCLLLYLLKGLVLLDYFQIT